jgi:hypothetical protein
MKRHLSATAFARLINKDPKTVIAWITRGLIPGAKRIGNIYQIPHEEVVKAKRLEQYPPGTQHPEPSKSTAKETWPT